MAVFRRVSAISSGRRMAIILATVRSICFGFRRQVEASFHRSSYRFCLPNF